MSVPRNSTAIPVSRRHLPQEKAIPDLVKDYLDESGQFSEAPARRDWKNN